MPREVGPTHMFAGAERPERTECPTCGRSLKGLMSIDHERPGLCASLRGDGGTAWRLFVTFAVCLLVALFLTGLNALVGS